LRSSSTLGMEAAWVSEMLDFTLSQHRIQQSTTLQNTAIEESSATPSGHIAYTLIFNNRCQTTIVAYSEIQRET
jgi:hypothetical protein